MGEILVSLEGEPDVREAVRSFLQEGEPDRREAVRCFCREGEPDGRKMHEFVYRLKRVN